MSQIFKAAMKNVLSQRRWCKASGNSIYSCKHSASVFRSYDIRIFM